MLTWLKQQFPSAGLTAFITHPDCMLHNVGEGHPEAPERLVAIRDQLKDLGLTIEDTAAGTRIKSL